MTTADLPAVAAEECEKVSVCCGAPENSDIEGFCAQCRDGTGFECAVHEDSCPPVGEPCRGVHRSIDDNNIQVEDCADCGVPLCTTCWGKGYIDERGWPWPTTPCGCGGTGVAA